MADTDNTEPIEQDDQQAATDDQTTETEQGAKPGEYRGAGSKDALKADLARERDKRQAFEQQLADMRAGFAKALGIEQPEAMTPEQMTEKVTAAQKGEAEARRNLAVYQRAAGAGANPTALLDSASFLAAVGQVDPADPAAIDAAIRAAVESNPALAAQPKSGAGWGDAMAGRNTQQPTDADSEALSILGF